VKYSYPPLFPNNWLQDGTVVKLKGQVESCVWMYEVNVAFCFLQVPLARWGSAMLKVSRGASPALQGGNKSRGARLLVRNSLLRWGVRLQPPLVDRRHNGVITINVRMRWPNF